MPLARIAYALESVVPAECRDGSPLGCGLCELAQSFQKVITILTELAVPLAGKKSKLMYNDLVKYFGNGRLGLDERTPQSCLKQLQDAFPEWEHLIQRSFLSSEMKKAYLDLFSERRERLKL